MLVDSNEKESSLESLNDICGRNLKCRRKYYVSCHEIGLRLIYSAALEEERLASFLEAESKRIRISAYRLRKNPCVKVDTEDLINANRCVTERIRRIACAEKRIIEKIKKGKKLLLCEDICEIPCMPALEPIENSCINIQVIALISLIVLSNSYRNNSNCQNDNLIFVFIMVILSINTIGYLYNF